MAMVSFRADDADVSAADHWAQRLGVDRSELLRDALRRHLAELAADHDVAGDAEHPLTHDETSVANIAD
jgi:metal-responsive CopG/Arc/MetJ family transcriptional regulator